MCILSVDSCDPWMALARAAINWFRDPEWRNSAVFTREEVERLLSDERIQIDQRVHYPVPR
jgi:hypothetical protein